MNMAALLHGRIIKGIASGAVRSSNRSQNGRLAVVLNVTRTMQVKGIKVIFRLLRMIVNRLWRRRENTSAEIRDLKQTVPDSKHYWLIKGEKND